MLLKDTSQQQAWILSAPYGHKLHYHNITDDVIVSKMYWFGRFLLISFLLIVRLRSDMAMCHAIFIN